MEIQSKRTTIQQIYPVLDLVIDGKKARLGLEQKYAEKYGAVFLGPEWEGDTSWRLPKDASIGQRSQVLKGYTRDPEIARVYLEWRKAINAEVSR